MGNVQFGVPPELVARIRADTAIRYAVETGTFLGGSTVVLARSFDRVWTIEPTPAYVERARRTVAEAGCVDTVELVEGESGACLGDVLAAVDAPALFWLDGHWSPWMPAGALRQCPLLHELHAIARWPHADRSVLLIDDVAVFREWAAGGAAGELPVRPEEWPTLEEVSGLLAEGFGGHEVSEVDDVLVVRPAA